MKYLPDGLQGLVELLAKANNGTSPVKKRMISMILNGDRNDRHGVLELFKAVTDAEMKRRKKVAKKLAEKLAA